ncbi:MAG: M23 family metallopeptidase [Candidatus Acidiferrales bacterium]
MKPETYTFFMASNRRGTMRKVSVPIYALHLLAILAVVGTITVVAAVGSYSRMLWKVGDYNSLRRQQDTLQRQYKQLQTTVVDTDQRLDSLQSLATEVAMTYGIMRLPQSPFTGDNAPAETDTAFNRSIAQYQFLERNASAVAVVSAGVALMPQPTLADSEFTPSLWPVIGHLTAGFGERLDPFSGEGAFHTGVDISSQYGTAVHATADGVVIGAEEHVGYGRLVVLDHGFGVTTFYGHLSAYNVTPGQRVNRGDVIGYVGVSGRTTGPHVHYEVRINGAPVNPMRYLRSTVTVASD